MPPTILPPVNSFRSGQWVRFELEPNPKLLASTWIDEPELDEAGQPVVGEDGKPRQKRLLRAVAATLESEHDVAALTAKMRTSQCGRFVGIFVKGGQFQDGHGGFVQMPDSIAPQRTVLGPNGEQNIEWVWEGKATVALLMLDSVRNVEALLLREDLPEHRNATCHEQWNPRK